MDIDAALGQLSRLEGGAITELANIVRGLTATVQALEGIWYGEDADRFQEIWTQQHQVNLTLLYGALADLGGALSRAISDQQAVSEH